MEGFSQLGKCTQSAIEVPNIKGQDQRVEGIGKGVFIPSSFNSPFCDPSMTLPCTNWTSGGGSGKTKSVKKNEGIELEKMKMRRIFKC
jgi:hypothetical protein